MNRSRGFTLIELMIAVAIVAILAAIALPSYSEYVKRGRVTEAVSQLSGMRVKMEQFFQDNRTYVGSCAVNTVAPPASSPNFDYDCPTRSATQYLITATGKNGTSMQGFQYTMDDQNRRTTTMTSPSTWASNGSCWVVKKDGSC